MEISSRNIMITLVFKLIIYIDFKVLLGIITKLIFRGNKFDNAAKNLNS